MAVVSVSTHPGSARSREAGVTHEMLVAPAEQVSRNRSPMTTADRTLLLRASSDSACSVAAQGRSVVPASSVALPSLGGSTSAARRPPITAPMIGRARGRRRIAYETGTVDGRASVRAGRIANRRGDAAVRHALSMTGGTSALRYGCRDLPGRFLLGAASCVVSGVSIGWSGGSMSFRRARTLLVCLAALSLLALLPGTAAAHHGGGGGGGTGGGGGGGGTSTLSFSPNLLNFGSQANGTTSAPQTITATNTGSSSVFFNNVDQTGQFAIDYTIGVDNCIGSTLAPGASCQIQVTFNPNNTGSMPSDVAWTDNAAGSPQQVPLSGTGSGTQTPLAIDDQFFACSGGVCDITDGDPTIVNNFYANGFQANGGTPPYTWSGQVPAGVRLHSSGLIFGDPTTLGTTTFTVTVKDAAGNTQTGTFSLPTTNSPAPSPGGSCQTYGTLTDSLSGPAIGGQTPSGVGTADETKLSGCGGFSLLTVQVRNVNLPDGTVLWVTFDGKPIGEINLSRGSGTMPHYNMGDFSVGGFDQVRVFNSLPDSSPFQQILIGGGFG
jgi:hypothetical protein